MRCGEREVMVFPGFKAGSIQLVSDDDDDDDAGYLYDDDDIINGDDDGDL